MNKGYFLGVDGGATKSTLILLDSKGKKVFQTEGKSLNNRNLTKEKFVQNLNDLIIKAKKKGKILFSCFSLAAIDTETDRKKVIRLINKTENVNFPFIVVSDIESVLSSVDLENGGVIIAGTGSNYYAKNRNLVAKAGGLDYILTDEGSGFDIGQKVLRAAVKSSDGRGEKTILEKMVLKKARIKNMKDMVTLIYKENSKQKVGEFAPLTELALKKKDKIAKKILLSAVDELELGAKTVIKKVNLKGNFKIYLIGSVFKNKFLLEELKQRFKKRFKNVEIVIVKNPAIGAGKLAIKEWKKYYGKSR